jgi:hypothetical protein
MERTGALWGSLGFKKKQRVDPQYRTWGHSSSNRRESQGEKKAEQKTRRGEERVKVVNPPHRQN